MIVYKYYFGIRFAELGFEIILVINDVKDLIIVFPAIEVANELETVSATEQVRVWEILTVPPVKRTRCIDNYTRNGRGTCRHNNRFPNIYTAEYRGEYTYFSGWKWKRTHLCS